MPSFLVHMTLGKFIQDGKGLIIMMEAIWWRYEYIKLEENTFLLICDKDKHCGNVSTRHMEIQYVIISSIGKTINKALPQDINCINILNKIIIRNMTYSIIWYKTNRLIQCFKAFNRWYYYFYATSVTSVISDSVRPCPWAYPGKNTGVGCHFLLQCIQVRSESEVTQPCPTLRDPMDCSLPGSSIHEIFQARVLEWGAMIHLQKY